MKIKNMLFIILFLCKMDVIYTQISESSFLPLIFSYSVANTDIDVFTANDPHNFSSFRNLFRREAISRCKTIRTTYNHDSYPIGSKIVEEYKYKDGLPTSRLYSYSGSESISFTTYDEYNRLLRSGENFSYEYSDEKSSVANERTKLFKGSIKAYQKVEITPSGFIFTEDDSSSIFGLITIEYTYQNAVISEIRRTYEHRLSSRITTFKYSDGLLKEIVTIHGKEEPPRVITKIKMYDKESNVLELEHTINERTGSTITNWYFTDYDIYGNWQKADVYRNEKLIDTYKREIEYIY